MPKKLTKPQRAMKKGWNQRKRAGGKLDEKQDAPIVGLYEATGQPSGKDSMLHRSGPAARRKWKKTLKGKGPAKKVTKGGMKRDARGRFVKRG